MNRLPQEIIDRIASHVRQDYIYERNNAEENHNVVKPYPQLATLSHTWKKAIELSVFRSLRISNHELEIFSAYLTDDRRYYLQCLRLYFDLPPYSLEQFAKRESQLEQQCNNVVFTEAVSKVLKILSNWEAAGVQTRLRLVIGRCLSPSDNDYDDKDVSKSTDKQESYEEYRFENNLIRLLDDASLPRINNVYSLQIRNYTERTLDPSVGTRLAQSLPNLEAIHWRFKDDSNDQERRAETRVTFARGLESMLQTNSFLQSLSLDLTRMNPHSQKFWEVNGVPTDLSYDPVSAALRKLSLNLKKLDISGCVDPTIFWPAPGEADSQMPIWPFLESLRVHFDLVAPCGRWYLTGPGTEEREATEEEMQTIITKTRGKNTKQIRRYIDERMFLPFATAAVKAACSMPAIQVFHITTAGIERFGRFKISYYAPGQLADDSCDDVVEMKNLTSFRRMYYQVGGIWEPSRTVREGFYRIGRQRHGGEMVERLFRGERGQWQPPALWNWSS